MSGFGRMILYCMVILTTTLWLNQTKMDHWLGYIPFLAEELFINSATYADSQVLNKHCAFVLLLISLSTIIIRVIQKLAIN